MIINLNFIDDLLRMEFFLIIIKSLEREYKMSIKITIYQNNFFTINFGNAKKYINF